MSIFHQIHFTHRFPVPLLALEHLETLSKAVPLPEAIVATLIHCCDRKPPTEEDMDYFLERVKELDKPKEKSTNKNPQGKSLGTSFNKFLSKLPADRVLVMACGWDIAKADHLYSTVDASIAVQVIEDYLSLQQESNTFLYEAVLYGFGGKYDGDEGGSEDLDLTGASAADISALFR
ncbi:hypothetical protein [Methylovulum miyakonense]|uniref:hypothetical protein n=1 Tax=Methylovulum miyakonense TaxID=645578 RepID=UPI00035EE0C6|nr:hypothetical protein [Methylovulum miyakonense]